MVWWTYQALIEVLVRGLSLIFTHLFLFFRGSRVYATETAHEAWGASRGTKRDTHRAPQVLPGQHEWQEMEETCYLAGHSTGLGLRWFQPDIKTWGWEQVWCGERMTTDGVSVTCLCNDQGLWKRWIFFFFFFTLHRFMKNFSWSWNVLRTFKTTSKCFSAQYPKTDVIP